MHHTRVSSDPDTNNEPFEFQAIALTQPRCPYSNHEQEDTHQKATNKTSVHRITTRVKCSANEARFKKHRKRMYIPIYVKVTPTFLRK